MCFFLSRITSITSSYNSFSSSVYCSTLSLRLCLFTIAPLPVKIFPNRLTPSVPNNILRNRPLCSSASFWIVSLTPSGNKQESSRDLTILIMSLISSFDIISIALFFEAEEEEWRWSDPQNFLCIPASPADAAAAKPRGIKTL